MYTEYCLISLRETEINISISSSLMHFKYAQYLFDRYHSHYICYITLHSSILV